MTTRIGLGTILGPLRHLPIEIIARIKEEADLTKRLEKINRWVNMWISDVGIGTSSGQTIGWNFLLKALTQLDNAKIVFVGCGNESAIPDPRLPCHEVLAFLMI